jgi:hypothetical protein
MLGGAHIRVLWLMAMVKREVASRVANGGVQCGLAGALLQRSLEV